MAILDNITRGGQTWAHRIRMFKQVFRIALLGGIIAFLGVFLMLTYHKTPKHQYKAFYYYVKGSVLGMVQDKIAVDSNYYYPGKITQKRQVLVEKITLEKRSKKDIEFFLETSKKHILPSGAAAVGLFAFSMVFFYAQGGFSKKEKVLSGAQLKKRRISSLNLRGNIRIGKALLSIDDETQHILVSGGTGSGKTNAFHHIIPQIRKRGQRAVIVDTSGTFIAKYYDPSKDFILNPLDRRSEKWLPWAECTCDYDYKALAKSFIPSEPHDPDAYWNEAASTVFASLLKDQEAKRDIKELLELLLNASMADLSKSLEGTKGAAHIDPKSDKAAASVRSVASTHLECLDYLQPTTFPFSIKKWVQSEEQKSFLFLSCTTDQRAVLKPLLSAWYALAIRSLLSLPINLDRRLWLINDELPSMSRIMGLETCLTEGRKYGAAALLAIQSPAQLEEIYGRHRMKTIMANCATKLVFREQDPMSAKLLSQIFGDKEVLETQEGLSYGSHEMRDGVNQSNILRNRRVIPPSEIQNLKKNEGFLKGSNANAIEKISLKYAELPDVAQGYEGL